jgi:hypothetical protein
MARLQRGRVPIQPTVTITDIRPLTRADISHLTVKREPKTLQSLRDNHHRIARAIASGLSNAEVAQTCGISIGRAHTLRVDPAMKELVAHKRAMIDAEWAAATDPVVEIMKSNAMKAAAMLSDKIDETAEKGEYLPTRDLVAIQEFGFDRTGYGKVNKNVNINVDFAAKLEEARVRSARAPAVRVIEGQSQPVPGPRSGTELQPNAPHEALPAPSPPKFRRM